MLVVNNGFTSLITHSRKSEGIDEPENMNQCKTNQLRASTGTIICCHHTHDEFDSPINA